MPAAHQAGREARQHLRGDLYIKSNYQDFQRYPEVDICHRGRCRSDAAVSDRSLQAADHRGPQERVRGARQEAGRRARASAGAGAHRGDLRLGRQPDQHRPPCPPSSGTQIKDKDWSLVGGAASRLWNVDKYYQTIGGGGAARGRLRRAGSVGAALANRKHGRLSVSIQNDGDLMYAPGVLWTAAHHRIPLLSVMHNNRAYHQEVMHIQRMANRHQRGITNAGIGTTIKIPTSISRPSRAAWACTAKDRSPIRRIWRRPSGGRSKWSSAASRPWSTS